MFFYLVKFMLFENAEAVCQLKVVAFSDFNQPPLIKSEDKARTEDADAQWFFSCAKDYGGIEG